MRGRAVGYVRVGKKDEDNEQHLAGSQIDLIAEWAAENEADVFDWFFDLGVSAAEPFDRRAAGTQLLDRVRRGGLDFVIVASLDVIAEGWGLFDALRLLMDAKQEVGVAVVLPSASDAATPTGIVSFPRPRRSGRGDQKAA